MRYYTIITIDLYENKIILTQLQQNKLKYERKENALDVTGNFQSVRQCSTLLS